ncbi:MAG: hypothetical protein GWO24_11245, partial [Akkermansiaceae bacterium]|nr:hypothetical protein [Akkermansiaceae bacterium]
MKNGLLVFLLLTGLGTLAFAQQGSRREKDSPSASLLGALDGNGDGRLSQEEIDMAVVVLRRLDRDGDGIVSQGELEPQPGVPGRGGEAGRRPGPPARRGGSEAVWLVLAKKYDQDGSGGIEKEEYPRGEEKFARLDRNRDGKLTKEDFRGGGRGGMASMAKSRL